MLGLFPLSPCFDLSSGALFPSAQIEKLYVPSISPSSVKSEDIKTNQLDDTYYSPCANSFVMVAHSLAFESLPNIQSHRLIKQIDCTYADLMSAMTGIEPLGYCSQKHLKEEGITALLTANITKCFSEYCRCQKLDIEIDDRVSIMHKSILTTKAGKGDMDIALFYRFFQTDGHFVHSGFKALFPLLFIEFTKTTTKSVDKKLPQSALYANHLFRLMDFEKRRTWVPLLGIIMSEYEMLFRIYSPSVVDNKWKIAEVDVMRCAVSSENLKRLVHIMVGWTVHCTRFLCSPSAATAPVALNSHLLLRKNSNIVALGNKMFKCFDYRAISERSDVHLTHRRDPDMYFKSDLTGLERIVDWTSSNNPEDRLQIISYDIVEGSHSPYYTGHFTQVLRKLHELHAQRVVHGDLHFLNILFSRPSDTAPLASTIIDFDYSGLEGEKIYPPRFNTVIEHGFRHAGAVPGEFLRVEHDIAAVRWMCEQYRPKREDLREEWSSCVAELGDDLLSIIGRLSPHEFEEIESVALNRVDDVGFKGTGSPDVKRCSEMG
jgi:hypothetical protein